MCQKQTSNVTLSSIHCDPKSQPPTVQSGTGMSATRHGPTDRLGISQGSQRRRGERSSGSRSDRSFSTKSLHIGVTNEFGMVRITNCKPTKGTIPDAGHYRLAELGFIGANF
jgi:hypothetical protein